MLKDNILKNVNIIVRKHQQKIDRFPFQLKDELEIVVKKNNNVIDRIKNK